MPQQAYIDEDLSVLTLSPEDVGRLLNDPGVDTRLSMTDRIAQAYTRRVLNERETQIAEQIFRLLMRDTEVKVRATLAAHVKDNTAIPRDIVMTMVRDVEEVALPVLQYSEVLTDDDLAQLIDSTRQVARYLAISKRRRVTAAIAGKLLEKGPGDVASALMKNPGAELGEKEFDQILTLHRASESLMQTLSERPSLPVATVEKMVRVVSTTLASKIKQKHRAASDQIDQDVEKTQESETLRLIGMAGDDAENEKLVAQLADDKRLTPALLLSALGKGGFRFFETGLARLSNIPVANARKLIADRGELGFKGIYAKSGLPETMFPAVKLLLKVVREMDALGERPGSPRYVNGVIERILRYAEAEKTGNLSYIIALVRKSA